MTFILALFLFLSGVTQYTPTRSSLDNVLEGTFVSCPDGLNGAFGEKVFDYQDGLGKVLGEVHLGPRDEFAVFKAGVFEERAHDTKDNLLYPNYRFKPTSASGGQTWTTTDPVLKLSVFATPGSFDECFTYWIFARKR